MGKDDVEVREELYFEHWCNRIHALAAEAGAEVTPFEHNLEVWRQLWRVTEFSDVVLLVTDARYPTFHLPPSLVQELASRAVIVLKTEGIACEQVLVVTNAECAGSKFVPRPCATELRGLDEVAIGGRRKQSDLRHPAAASTFTTPTTSSAVAVAATKSTPERAWRCESVATACTT